MFTAINQATDELVFESASLDVLKVMIDSYQRNVANDIVNVLNEDGSTLETMPSLRKTKGYTFTRIGVHVRVHPEDKQAVLDHANNLNQRRTER